MGCDTALFEAHHLTRECPAADLLRMPHSGVARLSLPESDEALVEALCEQRPGAAAMLFDRYAVHVRRVLARVLGPDPDLLDLVQDVFVTALESIAKLEEPRALRAWLTQIAIFSARTRIRRRTRWRFLRFMPSEELPELALAAVDYDGSEALQAVYRVLAQLDADDRIAFALRFIEGMELSDVASSCKVSLATIKRRLSRAQLSFREAARPEPALAEWLGGVP
jgi:RNA polymerase sigma-70 factor, ECF subfamily